MLHTKYKKFIISERGKKSRLKCKVSDWSKILSKKLIISQNRIPGSSAFWIISSPQYRWTPHAKTSPHAKTGRDFSHTSLGGKSYSLPEISCQAIVPTSLSINHDRLNFFPESSMVRLWYCVRPWSLVASELYLLETLAVHHLCLLLFLLDELMNILSACLFIHFRRKFSKVRDTRSNNFAKTWLWHRIIFAWSTRLCQKLQQRLDLNKCQNKMTLSPRSSGTDLYQIQKIGVV